MHINTKSYRISQYDLGQNNTYEIILIDHILIDHIKYVFNLRTIFRKFTH